MTQPLTLLHLVSEQTMQNLLPLLALEPKVVVQVRSSAARFHKAAENLKSAVHAISKTTRYCELAPEFFEVVIDENSPSTDRTRRKVGEALSLWPGAVVNLTGGTKQMSIGAYLAAEYQREPILYCDTQERRFVSLNEKCRLPKLPSFEEVAASLNVETVMAAHAHAPGSWKSHPPSLALEAFGTQAASIRSTASPKQFEQLVWALKRHFRPESKYLASIAPLLADSPLKAEYFAAAHKAGLMALAGNSVGGLESVLDRRAAVEPAPTAYEPVRQSKRDNERLHKLLDGLWLELHVLDLLKGNPRFQDTHWSVEPGGTEADFGETDILCVDRLRAGLLLVSCKSIAPGLEHFEALRRRAELFGGSHTQAVLCVFYPPAHAVECRRWATSLNLTLLIGETEITRFIAPARAT